MSNALIPDMDVGIITSVKAAKLFDFYGPPVKPPSTSLARVLKCQ